jgi:hypothetical protein
VTFVTHHFATTDVLRAKCVVVHVGTDDPTSDKEACMQLLRLSMRLELPTVLAGTPPASVLRAAHDLTMDSVVWGESIASNLWGAIAAARACVVLRRITSQIEDELTLAPALRAAIRIAAASVAGADRVGNLANLVRCHRSTLAKE